MKRKVGLVLIFAAVLPLAATSIAWACGRLSVINTNVKVASPGQEINVTGRNFDVRAGSSPVSIRLKTRTGEVLATTAPNSSGIINATVRMPANADPGWYVMLATQTLSNGLPASGTPGRTTFRVNPPQNAAAAPTGTAWNAPSGPAADGSGSLTLLLAIGLSLAMLAGGWTLVARTGRSASRPLGI